MGWEEIRGGERKVVREMVGKIRWWEQDKVKGEGYGRRGMR